MLGMGRVFTLVFAGIYCSSLTLASQKIPREAVMADNDEIEFPSYVVDDKVAGAPGSPIDGNSWVTSGAAHKTITEEASAPCDMQGNLVDMSPGEDPVVVPITRQPFPDPSIKWARDRRGRIHLRQFACLATYFSANIDPPVIPNYNLFLAQCEGNDKAGAALPFEYDVTDCACTCAGVNSDCGPMGSTTYYSSVSSAETCAEMICHKNQFSFCTWQGELVSSGLWVGNAIKFNSSVLELAPAPPRNHTTTTNTTAPGRQPHGPNPANGTGTPPGPQGGSGSGGGLLDNFPSPSPTPSPVPTFDEILAAHVLKLIGTLADNACMDLDHCLVSSLAAEAKAVNFSVAFVNPCTYTQTQLSSANVTEVRGVMERNDFVSNALAGYNAESPLARDAARPATADMNLNEHLAECGPDCQMLMSVLHTADPMEIRAFATAVRLLQNFVSTDVQCSPNTPSVDEIVFRGLALNVTCPPAESQTTGDSDVIELNSWLTQLIRRIKVATGISGPQPKRPPPPAQEPAFRGMSADSDRPPQFPPLAVNPSEIVLPDGEEGMLATVGPDCEDADSELVVANVPSAEDLQRVPGRRDFWERPTSTYPELPLFGRQKLEWAPRDGGVVLAKQPPRFDLQA